MNKTDIENRFNLVAKKYDQDRKYFLPCFDDFYGIPINILKYLKPELNNILDLGAGTGLLTKFIYAEYEDSNYDLIDLSKDMLNIAKERFNCLDKFKYFTEDYINFINENYYDLICSALSIHHLGESDKEKLYQNIYNNLKSDGIFINLDQFNGENDFIDKAYSNVWYNKIQNSPLTEESKNLWLERKKLDKENSIKDTINLLKASGFTKVEVVYQYLKFAVIIAKK